MYEFMIRYTTERGTLRTVYTREIEINGIWLLCLDRSSVETIIKADTVREIKVEKVNR